MPINHYPPQDQHQDPRAVEQSRDDWRLLAQILCCIVLFLLMALFVSAHRVESLEDQISGIAYVSEFHA